MKTNTQLLQIIHTRLCLFALFASAALLTHSLHCMITDYMPATYTTITQPDDHEITKMRLLPVEQFIKKNPNIHIARIATAHEKDDVCFDYALQHITGVTRQLGFVKNVDWIYHTHHIAHYFQPTDTPKKFDLAIHINDKRIIQHFSVVINSAPLTLESKWGLYEKILHHGLFDIPIEYGNAVNFWTLQKQYRSDDDKQLLLNKIKREAKKSLLLSITGQQCLSEDELDALIEENKDFLSRFD